MRSTRPTASSLFGDGVHGAIPRDGARVTTTYTSVHRSVFAFIKAMKAVDPNIQVCTSWGVPAFIEAAGDRRYNCFSAHAYTHFEAAGHDDWSTRLEGHDWNILGEAETRAEIKRLQQLLPSGTALPLTEFGPLFGDEQTWPRWTTSMTEALYMTSAWIGWAKMGIPYALGDDLATGSIRGLLGEQPTFTFSAEGVARQTIAPMFQAGGHVVGLDIAGNPTRDPGLDAGRYPALAALATRDGRGRLWVLVVNRLPLDGQTVRTRIALEGFTAARTAAVRTVRTKSFQSTNVTGQPPAVELETGHRQTGRHGFTTTLRPHSITLYRFERRG